MEEKKFKFWLLPIVLIVLLLIATGDFGSGFYTFLRIFVCLLSLNLAFIIHMHDGKRAMITINIIIAILWNPIIPIYFEKDTWVGLDIIASIVECVIGVYSYRIWRKEGIEQGYIKKREPKVRERKIHYKDVYDAIETFLAIFMLIVLIILATISVAMAIK